ncbi:MAG: hypothetical protein ACOC6B_05365 [Thermodesulfobacteriota bacterium]
MRITIVLNGGLKSCCSTYPPEYVHEIVKNWMDGICHVAVIDAEKESWNPDELASLSIKYFDQQAYPFIYIDDLLMDTGRIPPKEELITILSQEPRRGITRHDLEEAATRYGKIKE